MCLSSGYKEWSLVGLALGFYIQNRDVCYRTYDSNYNVHTNHVGIILKCRFRFRRSKLGLRSAFWQDPPWYWCFQVYGSHFEKQRCRVKSWATEDARSLGLVPAPSLTSCENLLISLKLWVFLIYKMMELDLVISKSMTKPIQQEKEALYINHGV